jgi:hypothetical protein
MADYNARFVKPPAIAKKLHRLPRAGDDPDNAFARKEQRTLPRAPTLQYDRVLFILGDEREQGHVEPDPAQRLGAYMAE